MSLAGFANLYEIITGKDFEPSDPDKDSNIYEQIDEINSNLSTPFQVFFYPCCSNLNQNRFILGYEIRRYHRYLSTCDKCPKRFQVCDECFNKTENGSYDMQHIFDNVVTLDADNVCRFCFSDNREKIGYSCKVCNYPQGNKTQTHPALARAYRVIKKFIPVDQKSIKIYLLMDDCISCT